MLIARQAPLVAPVVEKWVNGCDYSAKNAFPRAASITFSARVPRTLGVAAVVLRLCPDGGAWRDFAFSFTDCTNGVDTYCLQLPLFEIAPRTGGLFFYEYLFVRGADTLFSDSEDNTCFALSAHSARRFRLLVYESGAESSERFQGRVLYHIFVDRFAPGGGERREDAVYHAQWLEDICQFGAVPGAPVANNEFYGGTLWGVLSKLDYLESLGVGALYLSPVFRADSNHKYDTGDYEQVDVQFGGETALRALLAACAQRDIMVILDGVFNHTGDDSRYFNRRARYAQTGAYQSTASPYYDWYIWQHHPDAYACWWDIPILPKLRLENPAVHRYFVGEEGIVARYTKMGVSGWRLDVADELPNAFLEELRNVVKRETGGNGVILGEVWENAADKMAYGKRRRYFFGRQLDGVMNYPLRRGIISFVRDGVAHALCSVLRELWSSYPTHVCHCLMNVLSTHDTARILTVLAGDRPEGKSNAQLRDMRLDAAQRVRARQLGCMAAVLQYTAFGVPSLFYGDEAGLEGYHDPFCRRPYPWGREDDTLLTFYRKLGKIRRESTALRAGEFRLLREDSAALVYERVDAHERLIVAANRGKLPLAFRLPDGAVELISGERVLKNACVAPDTAVIWRIENVQKDLGNVDEKQEPRKQALSL